MASLFETLQKRLSAPAPSAAPAMGQEQIQKTLAAKSGKAGMGGGGPKASSIGQQVAQQQVAGAQAQQQTAGQMVAAQLGQAAAGIQQQREQALQSLESKKQQGMADIGAQQQTTLAKIGAQEEISEEQRNAQEELKATQMLHHNRLAIDKLASERGVQMDDIFSTFAASNKELEFRQDAAQLEQLGHQIMMQNKEYSQAIREAGAYERLHNDSNFQEKLAETMIAESLRNTKEAIKFKELFAQNERDFEKELAQMDISSLIDLNRLAAQAEMQQQMFEAGGKAVSTGIDAYIKNRDSTPTPSKSQGTFV